MRRDEQGHTTILDVRCACAACGAHVMAWQGHGLSGWCSVCGSYELRALPAPALSRHGRLRDQLVFGQQAVLHCEQAGGRAA